MSFSASNDYSDYVVNSYVRPEYELKTVHEEYSVEKKIQKGLRKYSREELKYYADYDPMIGYRIAVTLGLLILLFIVFVLYKTHCAAKRNQRLIMQASASVPTSTTAANNTATTNNTTTVTTTPAMKTILATTTIKTTAGHPRTTTHFLEAAPLPLRTNIYKPKHAKSKRPSKRSLQAIV